MDGDAVYLAYLIYQDYNNYYNQDYSTRFLNQTESERFAYVDIGNGTVKLLNPYKIG